MTRVSRFEYAFHKRILSAARSEAELLQDVRQLLIRLSAQLLSCVRLLFACKTSASAPAPACILDYKAGLGREEEHQSSLLFGVLERQSCLPLSAASSRLLCSPTAAFCAP